MDFEDFIDAENTAEASIKPESPLCSPLALFETDAAIALMKIVTHTDSRFQKLQKEILEKGDPNDERYGNIAIDDLPQLRKLLDDLTFTPQATPQSGDELEILQDQFSLCLANILSRHAIIQEHQKVVPPYEPLDVLLKARVFFNRKDKQPWIYSDAEKLWHQFTQFFRIRWTRPIYTIVSEARREFIGFLENSQAED
jgi:hypothetical protein